MMRFLRQHGFWGIFLLSAVPNMAFDLCGICCGHFGMPFWQFFGGTLLGKAGVRVSARVKKYPVNKHDSAEVVVVGYIFVVVLK